LKKLMPSCIIQNYADYWLGYDISATHARKKR
jgi:hypothetical protein